MIQVLTEKAKSLVEELKSIETQFTVKKEEYLKVQGALEALHELEEDLTAKAKAAKL